MTSRRLGWGVLLAVLVGGAPAPAATPDDAQRAYAAGRFEEARRLWEPRAEAGDAEAQFGLGLLFDIGQGVAQDPASAYRWYRRAAEAGMAEAQFNVAVMHDTGEGRPRDPAAAALWYSRAAAHGNRRAQFNLAQLYAAGQGLPDAKYALGLMVRYHVPGLLEDTVMAYMLWKLAAAAGHRQAERQRAALAQRFLNITEWKDS